MGTLFACGAQTYNFELKEYYFSIYEGDSRVIEKISDGNFSYSYEVGNNEIVSVNNDGVVTGLKAGASTVIVKSGEFSQTMMVEVIANQRYIKLNVTETNKVLGSTFDIIATVYEKGAVSTKNVQWAVSTECAKTINGNVLTSCCATPFC
jgi:hypothetical protein